MYSAAALVESAAAACKYWSVKIHYFSFHFSFENYVSLKNKK